MTLRKRVEKLEREMAALNSIPTYEFGNVSVKWLARALAEHLKNAATDAGDKKTIFEKDTR